MNALVEALDLWGTSALRSAWPMLWQSSLLIGLLFATDAVLRRRLRASVRYALWLVVLLKLVLPPALSFPTGVGWWLRPAMPTPEKPAPMTFTVSYDEALAAGPEAQVVSVSVPPSRLSVSAAGWAFAGASVMSATLMALMLMKWLRLARDIRHAAAAPAPLCDMLEEARQALGLRRSIRLRLTEQPMSPAVCGLFRPVILLPRALVAQLPGQQLRAVLLHELVHLRRGDVWVNCGQALLQLAYWWHPLLWLANARIRQLREEAVDDSVMLALRGEAETYAPTLLKVAKLALQRRMPSLGLVGILESRHSLRRRVQRLVEFHPPRRAGLSVVSSLCVVAFAAVAVPMGQAPARSNPATGDAVSDQSGQPMDGSSREDQADLAGAREKLRILESATNPATRGMLLSAETLRRADAFRIASKLDLACQEGLLTKLRSLTSAEQVPMIMAVAPDSLLASLLNQRSKVEFELAIAQRESRTNETELIELETERNYWNSQVAQRVSGILVELDVKVSVLRVGVSNLEHEVAMAASNDLKTAHQNSASDRISGALVTLKGILTDPQYRVAVRAMNDRDAASTSSSSSDAANSPSGRTSPPGVFSSSGFDWYLGNLVMTNPPQGSQQLHRRTFKIDRKKFYETVRVWAGLPADADEGKEFEAAMNYFKAKGVDLTPPKSIFFSEGLSSYSIRATKPELDTIGKLLQDYALPPGSANLWTRRFRVDPATIMPRARAALGLAGGDPADGVAVPETLRALFASKGVDLSPPKSIFFGDRLGFLFVRATMADLDKCGAVLSSLEAGGPMAGNTDQAPPQIHIKAQLVQLPEDEAQAFCTRFWAPNGPGVKNWWVTLSKAQVAEQLAQWKSGRAEFLSSPAITMLSGRKGQMSVQQIITVVHVTNSVPEPEPVPVGTVITVTPNVTGDGNSIRLDVTALQTEFLGQTNQVIVDQSPTTLFRRQELAAHVSVPDGQTLVVGGASVEIVSNLRDKVPVLGDIPIVGKLFRSESTSTRRMQLFLLLTPTLTDGAGNSLHPQP